MQEPNNTQNYNKYGYCLNNPLKYSDPSGEVIGFLGAVLIGAAVAALTYTFTAALTDVPFSLGGLAKATFIGAASAAVTFGIGSACSTIGNFYIRATVQALSHGTFQGGMTAISGGKFWSGFAAGALSSIAACVWSGGSSYGESGVEIYNSGMQGIGSGTGDLGMIAFGTVSGGVSAELTGGNFWQGAVTGLVVSGLNHYAHRADAKYEFNKELRARFAAGNVDPDGKPDLSLKGALNLNKNVEGLEQAYNDGGKPNVRFDIKSNKYVGLTDFGDVNLNPSKISTNLKFAAVLFHEYRHAWQYASGNYYHWQKEFGYGATENYQERDAYWFQVKMGAGSFFDGYSRYSHYSSLTKNITYK